jgi:hypothetical protein
MQRQIDTRAHTHTHTHTHHEVPVSRRAGQFSRHLATLASELRQSIGKKTIDGHPLQLKIRKEKKIGLSQ